MSQYLFGSICLSDLPRQLAFPAAGGHKLLLGINVTARRDPSQYGHTHMMTATLQDGSEPQQRIYIGDFKLYESNRVDDTTPFPDRLSGSLNLNDIPSRVGRTGANGKIYLSVNIDPRKAPSALGSTHYIKIARSKEDAAAGTPTVYLGDLAPVK